MSFNVEDDNNDTEEESDFQKEEDVKYSKTALVMMALKKCLEANGKEMRSGYWNDRLDKNGNIAKTYIPDSKKELIESVENLQNFAVADIKKEQPKIAKLKEDLMKKYEQLCDEEEQDWENAHYKELQWRASMGYSPRKHYLSTFLPYYHEYMDEEVKTSREILKIINESLSSNPDYQGEGDAKG